MTTPKLTTKRRINLRSSFPVSPRLIGYLQEVCGPTAFYVTAPFWPSLSGRPVHHTASAAFCQFPPPGQGGHP